MSKSFVWVFLSLFCAAAITGCGKSQGSLPSVQGEVMNITPGITMTLMQEDRRTGDMDMYIFRLDPPPQIEGARDIRQIRQGQTITVWYTEKSGVKYAKKIREGR